jgi:hypothetical protein
MAFISEKPRLAGRLRGLFGKASGGPVLGWIRWRGPEPDLPGSRGSRQPNEIDFWRGFALITIFINHIPGLYFENYTHRHLGFSDAADLFVFLAGWSLRLVVNSQHKVITFPRLLLHLGGRAFVIYMAQILLTSFALAITAAGALLLNAPPLLEWNNAAAAWQDPVQANIGIVLLTYQLGYFDILPLYVVLMFLAPLIAIIDHYARRALLPLSLLLYLTVLMTEFNLSTWPVEGRWFFNPLAWQLMFVLGFVMAAGNQATEWVSRRRLQARLLALPLLIAAFWVVRTEWTPDLSDWTRGTLFLTVDKTYLTPARVVHLLLLVTFVGGAFTILHGYARPLTRLLSMLGRNSLHVFCVGSVLSLIGQFVRFASAGSLWVDFVVVVLGVLLLSLTAWVSEWRHRLRTP